MRQCTSPERADLTALSHPAEGDLDWDPPAAGRAEAAGPKSVRRLTLSLSSRHGETALFGLSTQDEPDRSEGRQSEITREIRVLGDYLHSHVLRISGHDANAQMLVSARELDCLRWAAAGKTA